MSKAQAGLTLIAIMDGTTVNGYAKVFNTPLIQRYTKGSQKNFIPDFEKLSDTKKPVVVAFLRDAMSGKVLTPKAITFKYNGTELAFGPDGLCNTQGFTGMFKRLNDYAVTVGSDTSKTYPMPALQVVKNLVPISGYDNDTISISGTVEVEGQTITFSELSTPVVIQESNGGQYDVIIEDDNGRCLDATKDRVTLTMTLLRDGVEVSDLSGCTIKWYKVSASGDVAMGTSKTQVVTKANVDNKQLFRCDVSIDGKVESGYIEISDYTDNYYVQFNVTDASGAVAGTSLRKGQTVKIAPVAISRESGTTVNFKECTFRTTNNKGADFTLTGKSSSKFTITAPTKIEVQVTYNDIQRAGYGLHLLIEGTV